MATYEPAELARELGYTNEARPGKVVREYLRKKYPDHPKYQRWVLDETQADDVRANVAPNHQFASQLRLVTDSSLQELGGD